MELNIVFMLNFEFSSVYKFTIFFLKYYNLFTKISYSYDLQLSIQLLKSFMRIVNGIFN